MKSVKEVMPELAPPAVKPPALRHAIPASGVPVNRPTRNATYATTTVTGS